MPSNPFRGFMDSIHESNRAMEQWMRGYPDSSEINQRHSSQADAWTPEMEVISDEENLIILMELPGVESEEIELALSDGLLTIYGEKKSHVSEGERHLRERRLGTFRRSLTLHSGVSEDSMDASLQNGLLQITVRDYASVSKPRLVQIASGEARS